MEKNKTISDLEELIGKQHAIMDNMKIKLSQYKEYLLEQEQRHYKRKDLYKPCINYRGRI